MREAMGKANLTAPIIESDRWKDEFSLTLLVHHLLDESDLKWLGRFTACKLNNDEARALIILREIGRLDNSIYRHVNRVDALSANGHLRRLRDFGLLEQQGKGASTYYIPGPRFFSGIAAKKPRTSAQRRELTDAQRRELTVLRRELTPDIRGVLDSLKGKVAPAELNEIIARLCGIRPFSMEQLALLLGRNPAHLQNRNIKNMLRDGKIQLLFPEKPNDPNQKYISPEVRE